MSIQDRNGALRHYEESLDRIKGATELNIGYLTCVHDTLMLWKSEWEDNSTNEATGKNSSSDVTIEDHTKSLRDKMKSDPHKSFKTNFLEWAYSGNS